MVCVSLVIESGGSSHDGCHPEKVDDEIPAGVKKGPNVDITGCIKTLCIVENGFVFTTDVEHSCYREENA